MKSHSSLLISILANWNKRENLTSKSNELFWLPLDEYYVDRYSRAYNEQAHTYFLWRGHQWYGTYEHGHY